MKFLIATIVYKSDTLIHNNVYLHNISINNYNYLHLHNIIIANRYIMRQRGYILYNLRSIYTYLNISG